MTMLKKTWICSNCYKIYNCLLLNLKFGLQHQYLLHLFIDYDQWITKHLRQSAAFYEVALRDMLLTVSPWTRLGRLVQSGLVDKWHGDEVTKFKQSAVQGKEEGQGGESNVEQGRVTVKPLMMDHLQVLKFFLKVLSHSLSHYNYFMLNSFIIPIALSCTFLLNLAPSLQASSTTVL